MRNKVIAKTPAVEPAPDESFPVAGKEITKDFNMNNSISSKNTNHFFDDDSAKLAFIDAAFDIINRIPAGYRSLSREEITPVEVPLHEFFGDLIAEACGGIAMHGGAWAFGRVRVCHRDDLELGAEPGWFRWRAPSADGIVRIFDWDAPWVTRSPSGALFWCQKGKAPLRVSLGKMLDRCIDWQKEVRP